MTTQPNYPNELDESAIEFSANLIAAGTSPEEVEQALMQGIGLDEEAAKLIVDQVFENEMREDLKKAASGKMLSGGLWCLGGVLVTVITYAFAQGGGTYFVAWGAILFGAIEFSQGLVSFDAT